MIQEKVTRRPQVTTPKRVSLTTSIAGAKDVVVTGDFTGWTTKGIRMLKGPNGEWNATLDLPPGEYQYRLLIDGKWADHAEATRRVANPFGCMNCVLTV